MDVPIGWDLRWAPLPAGIAGEVNFDSRVVTISPDYPPAYQRVAICHECVHIERGPAPASTYDAYEELAVEKATARRLIDVRDLGEAAAESDRLGYVAELLHVDPDTLTVRLKHLHPAERAYLKQRLENPLWGM